MLFVPVFPILLQVIRPLVARLNSRGSKEMKESLIVCIKAVCGACGVHPSRTPSLPVFVVHPHQVNIQGGFEDRVSSTSGQIAVDGSIRGPDEF